eukprot:2831386-Rhodomonas_salina.1
MEAMLTFVVVVQRPPSGPPPRPTSNPTSEPPCFGWTEAVLTLRVYMLGFLVPTCPCALSVPCRKLRWRVGFPGAVVPDQNQPDPARVQDQGVPR